MVGGPRGRHHHLPLHRLPLDRPVQEPGAAPSPRSALRIPTLVAQRRAVALISLTVHACPPSRTKCVLAMLAVTPLDLLLEIVRNVLVKVHLRK